MRSLLLCLLSVLTAASIALPQKAGDPVREVGVGLGKVPGPGMMMTLTPSNGDLLSGRLERGVPPGSSMILVDGQDRVLSQETVNPADGSFRFPVSRVPISPDFRACLRSPGAAQICSDPGALNKALFRLRTKPPRFEMPAATGLATSSSAALTPGGDTPVVQAPALSPADAAVLANVSITKAPNGTWKCTSVGGKTCSETEAKLMTTVTKSRSNTKNNLVTVASDGTVHCLRVSDGKACSDPEIQALAIQLKAITKGGTNGF